MYYNTASHIIYKILFFDFCDFYNVRDINLILSPINKDKPILKNYLIKIVFYQVNLKDKTFTVIIETENKDLFNKLLNYLKCCKNNILLRLNLIFKKDFEYNVITENTIDNNDYYFFVAELRGENISNVVSDCAKIYLSKEFVKLFKPKKFLIKHEYANESIDDSESIVENNICQYFIDAYNLFPKTEFIFKHLSDYQIQSLLYFLLNSKLLTPYHILLLINAFPEYSLKIKHNISHNLVKDINDIKSKVRINQRDIYEGVYAFEEIIFLKVNDFKISFSSFSENIKEIVKINKMLSMFINKSFHDWVEESLSNNLFLRVISKLDDLTIFNAFDDTVLRTILQKHISNRRFKNILDTNKTKYKDSLYAKYRFVDIYKQLLHVNHKIFKLPLKKAIRQNIITPQMMYHVLFKCGWFNIAIALKGLPIREIQHITKHFPLGARLCIEDMIKGVINYNMLHDEKQISDKQNLIKSYCIEVMNNGFIY